MSSVSPVSPGTTAADTAAGNPSSATEPPGASAALDGAPGIAGGATGEPGAVPSAQRAAGRSAASAPRVAQTSTAGSDGAVSSGALAAGDPAGSADIAPTDSSADEANRQSAGASTQTGDNSDMAPAPTPPGGAQRRGDAAIVPPVDRDAAEPARATSLASTDGAQSPRTAPPTTATAIGRDGSGADKSDGEFDFAAELAAKDPVASARAEAFARRTIRDCPVIRRLGEHIGAGRSRGEAEKVAIRSGVDRLAAEQGTERDERTMFTGRVYGILIYRLDEGHSSRIYGPYAYAVCRVFRETNRIIPVDSGSERFLNQRLSACQRNAVEPAALEACVVRGVRDVVDRVS